MTDVSPEPEVVEPAPTDVPVDVPDVVEPTPAPVADPVPEPVVETPAPLPTKEDFLAEGLRLLVKAENEAGILGDRLLAIAEKYLQLAKS